MQAKLDRPLSTPSRPSQVSKQASCRTLTTNACIASRRHLCMRKALGTMSFRLSALCAGTGQGKLLHNLPASEKTLRQLQPRICTTKGIVFSAYASIGLPARMFAAQTQSAVRPTQTSAYAAQYGYDQATDDKYVVEKMEWNSMAANAVSLIGNTGKDVEIKRLETGRVVGNLTLACAHKAGQTTW